MSEVSSISTTCLGARGPTPSPIRSKWRAGRCRPPVRKKKKKPEKLTQFHPEANGGTAATINKSYDFENITLHVQLTACLHHEQLMATISLLWKENFCWKPCWRQDAVVSCSDAATRLVYGGRSPSRTADTSPSGASGGPSGVAPRCTGEGERERVTRGGTYSGLNVVKN